MGKFSSKPKSVDTAAIRKQEEAKIRKENLEALQASEKRRSELRKRAFAEGEEEQITRKTLLGK